MQCRLRRFSCALVVKLKGSQSRESLENVEKVIARIGRTGYNGITGLGYKIIDFR